MNRTPRPTQLASSPGAMPPPRTAYFPRIHDTVFTLDGKDIGTVTAVLRDSFRIDRGGRVVTATFECLFNRDVGRVSLLCDETGLHRYLRH